MPDSRPDARFDPTLEAFGRGRCDGPLGKDHPVAAIRQATLGKPRNRREPASAEIRFIERVFVLE